MAVVDVDPRGRRHDVKREERDDVGERHAREERREGGAVPGAAPGAPVRAPRRAAERVRERDEVTDVVLHPRDELRDAVAVPVVDRGAVAARHGRRAELEVRQERARAVAAAAHRGHVVDVLQEADLREPHEDAAVEGRRAHAAAREREADAVAPRRREAEPRPPPVGRRAVLGEERRLVEQILWGRRRVLAHGDAAVAPDLLVVAARDQRHARVVQGIGRLHRDLDGSPGTTACAG